MKRIFGMLILFIGILSSPAFAQRSTMFPEFFSGDGWVCEIFFTNQDLYPVLGIEIAFYDFDGSPVLVNSNLGTATSYTFDLGAGATQVIQVNPEALYVEGYAVVTYPSNGSPVRGTLVFRYVDGEGNVTAEAGVPQQEYGYHYSFAVEVNSGQNINTAVAIVNPEILYSVEQVILINLIDSDGNITATARLPLAPGEHYSGYFTELFPGLDNTVASASVSSAFGAGVVAFRQDKNAFGATSTDAGPVLGPFAVSSPVVAEQEPNDDTPQAQLIAGSTVINGSIGAAFDKDYFAFTGNAGDIVSVICDAQLAGSWLDSVLEIRRSNGTLIAENDQNGLSPELYPVNDSFIQVELPADGTYYISVRDYFNDGDPSNFFYTLHVRITPGD